MQPEITQQTFEVDGQNLTVKTTMVATAVFDGHRIRSTQKQLQEALKQMVAQKRQLEAQIKDVEAQLADLENISTAYEERIGPVPELKNDPQ